MLFRGLDISKTESMYLETAVRQYILLVAGSVYFVMAINNMFSKRERIIATILVFLMPIIFPLNLYIMMFESMEPEKSSEVLAWFICSALPLFIILAEHIVLMIVFRKRRNSTHDNAN